MSSTKKTYTNDQIISFIEKKKEELTPETLMPWGKYKGTSLCLFWDHPTKERQSYVNWMQSTIKFDDYNYYLLDYIEDNMS